MPPAQRTVDIAAPPEAVWAYLADIPRWADWDPDIASVGQVRGTIEDGGSFSVQMTSGLRGRITFVSAEHARRSVWDACLVGGLVRAQGAFILTPLDGGHSRLCYRFQMVGLPGRVAGRLSGRMIQDGVRDGLENIVQATGGHRR
jgi:carbon monoxide dehydrogenase subunit G